MCPPLEPFLGGCCCRCIAKSCPALFHPMDSSTPGFPVHYYLQECAQTPVHRVKDAIQLSHPLSPPSPPALTFSQHQDSFPISRLFTSGGQGIGASASAWVLPRYSGLISFKIDGFDLLAVQRILKSLLQHHSSKASILRHSVFFMVQFSHPYVTIGKT